MAEERQEMNQLTIIDEKGQEVACEVLFTFRSEAYQKDYIAYMPVGDAYVDEDGYPEIHVYAYQANEDDTGGKLEFIEDDAEWEMLEEVVASFMEGEEDDEGPIS